MKMIAVMASGEYATSAKLVKTMAEAYDYLNDPDFFKGDVKPLDLSSIAPVDIEDELMKWWQSHDQFGWFKIEPVDVDQPIQLYTYRAQLVRCVDGDTVDLKVDLGFRTVIEDRFRVYGINTPERGRPGFHAATDRLRELILEEQEKGNGWLYIDTHKDTRGKYGRWLCTFVRPDIGHGWDGSINAQMIAEGHAVEYMR